MMRWFPVVAAVVVVAGPVFADSDKKPSKKEDSAFGVIKSVDAAEAKKQAADWLKSVKNDGETQKKFDAIWESDRPLIDKTSMTLALGDAEAAKLLAEAKDADAAAPMEVPAVLKDKKKPEFYRNNLALAYAKALTLRKVYEEALEAFAAVKGDEVVDPSAYFFHKAVCEYELMLKDKADESISKLIDVSDAPQRYLQVAILMAYDMQTWQEKDLGWIARKMDNIQRRLDLKRGGKNTQKMQKEVLVRLDEMIKEIENQQKQQGQCPNGGSCPNGSPGNGPDGEGKEKSNGPAKDTIKSSANGKGEVDTKKVKEIADVWGKLPEKERAKALVELTRGMPAKDRAVIEQYFKELAKKTK